MHTGIHACIQAYRHTWRHTGIHGDIEAYIYKFETNHLSFYYYLVSYLRRQADLKCARDRWGVDKTWGRP